MASDAAGFNLRRDRLDEFFFLLGYQVQRWQISCSDKLAGMFCVIVGEFFCSCFDHWGKTFLSRSWAALPALEQPGISN